MPLSTGRVRGLSVVLAAVLLGIGSGCSQTMGGAQSYVAGDGTVTTIAAADRNPVEGVAGETVEGKPISLGDYAGKIVVVNVWGSWCPPCRKEAPDLVAASEKLKPRGVQFLGINVRDTRAKAAAYDRTYDVPYPSIFDEDSSTLLGFTPRPQAIPSTLIVDRDGSVAAVISGPTTETTLVELVGDVDG